MSQRPDGIDAPKIRDEQVDVLFTYVKPHFRYLPDMLTGHDEAEDVAVGRMFEGEAVKFVERWRGFVEDLPTCCE